MKTSIQWFSRRVVNRIRRQLGYQAKPRPFTDYIVFNETVAAAKAAGLSVGQYIERGHNPGQRSALDETMDGLAALGVFIDPIEKVCEIGPGSGRYLEKTIARCRPQHYEIYETSPEWRNWLVQQYKVTARSCDGRTLAETESGSVGLVHAHKVFPGTPWLCTAANLQEMARVVREGGWVVFDVMTEACFRREHLKAWFDADQWQWEWSPRMTSRDYLVRLFADRGISLVGTFEVPLFPGITECMVFRKNILDSHMQRGK